MKVVEAAPWLVTAFTDAMLAIGAQASTQELNAEANQLIERWSAPQRACHNVKHLKRMFALIDELSVCSHHPQLLHVATWYHGAVFFRPRPMDFVHCGEDLQSGQALARQRLEHFMVPEETIMCVCAIIEEVRTQNIPEDDIDAQILSDAYYGALLGLFPQKYKEYRENVRAEYAHLPAKLYLLGRRKRIKTLLEREHLFRSPLAGDMEEIARGNLEAELKRVNSELGMRPDEDDLPEPKVNTNETTGTLIIKKSHTAQSARRNRDAELANTLTTGVPAVDLKDHERVAEQQRNADEESESVSSLEAVGDILDSLEPKTQRSSVPTPTRDDAPEVAEEDEDSEDN